MKRVWAFLEGFFKDKTELVLRIELLEAKVQQLQVNKEGRITPAQRMSAEEHQEALTKEVEEARRKARKMPAYIQQLLGDITLMPELTEEARTTAALRSAAYEKLFRDRLWTYFSRLRIELATLGEKFDRANPSAYRYARTAAAEFLNAYGCYPDQRGTYYRIEMLFDAKTVPNFAAVGIPCEEKDLVTVFRTATLFFFDALETVDFSKEPKEPVQSLR